MIQHRTIAPYHFGFSSNLTESQLCSLADFFQNPAPAGNSVLGGRSPTGPVQLDDIGAVVIKHYRRGGLIRYLVKGRYLRLGKIRARREFELLALVDKLGIHVPQPVAYAHRGRLFYQAWLVTRAIRQARSLARLSRQDEKTASRAMHSVAEQISSLIQNNILHIDLHPGNVVVDGGGKVYLLDFDKGRIFRGSRQKLINRYLTRWQRAVSKHNLPKILSEIMQNGLSQVQ